MTALGYYLSTLVSALTITLTAACICIVYLRVTGWYLSAADIAALFGDVVLLVLFGTALSSCLVYPMTTQGQASALGTVISAGYGFVCGAYMPISNFGEGLQKGLSYLPGTYGTSLIKNHMLHGVFEEMAAEGFPEEVVDTLKGALDCNPVFRGQVVTEHQMVIIMLASIVIFGMMYLLITNIPERG